MRIGPTIALVLVGALLVGILATGGVAAADASQHQHLESCATESPENYTAPEGGDAIGYVDGYWYDQPIRITNDSDGTSGSTETDGGNDTAEDGNQSTDGTESRDGTASEDGENVTATNQTESDGGDGNVTTDDGNETATSANDTTASNGNDSTASNGSETDEADWEEGRPLDLSDGLDEREIDAVVARTAARVETQRCLSFESVPEVRVTNRSALEADQRATLANRSTSVRQFDDARLSAAMVLGDRVDSTTARAATRSRSSLGYYDPATDEIVLVAAEDRTLIDEPTLAHELVHALQDQHFDLENYDADLTDAALAETGLIEGDASVVEHRYERRCERRDWSSACLRADGASEGNSDYLALELFFFQPYNDGARYVEHHYEAGGWEAVDARYADAPASSKALLAPGRADGVQPANVTFETDVGPAWQRVAPEDRPDHDVLGPGTIAAAMLAPTFDADVDEIYGGQYVTNNVDESTLHPLYPYDYGVDAATGWEGGTLEVYRNAADATAVRWRTEWESPEDAETFRDRYVQLLDVRGDAESGEYVDAYEFSGDAGFDGKASVRQNGTTVTVVHGPSVDALRALDQRAATEERTGSASSVGGIHASRRAAEDELGRQGALWGVGLVAVLLGASAWVVVRRR